MTIPPHLRGAAAASALCLLWAFAFVAIKWGLRDSEALWFGAARAGVAAVAVAPWLRLVRGWRLRDHAVAAALGATNVAGFLALQVAGFDRVDVGAAGAIVYTQPLIVIVAARLLLGERMSRQQLLGAVLGFAGVAVVGIRELSFGSPAGVALLLGAAASWAAGTIVLKRAARRPLLPLVAAQNLYGALPLLAAAALAEPLPHATTRWTLSVLYTGVLASVAGWLLLAWLLRRGAAGVVSSYNFSVPIIGAILGVLVLGEPLRATLAVGVVLVAAGVRLVAVPPRSPA